MSTIYVYAMHVVIVIAVTNTAIDLSLDIVIQLPKCSTILFTTRDI